jgi:GNAT superfamily N-acetyltransferase
MDQIIIRSATAADLDAIVANSIQMADEIEGRTLDAAKVRAGVAAVLADPGRDVYWLAEAGGRIVGHVMIMREWDEWHNAWCWWIESVYVTHGARRKGVYRRLHEHVVAEARRAGDVCGVRLYTESNNTRAQQVYERLGMRRAPFVMYELDWRGEGKAP